MPGALMRYHLLAPNVKCPSCGGGLTFIRVRGYGDLYQCAFLPLSGARRVRASWSRTLPLLQIVQNGVVIVPVQQLLARIQPAR
jgi:hypothetical protein